MNTRKGFTLVELLVVIAILAILATVSVVGYTSFINRANSSVAQQELTQVRDYAFSLDMVKGIGDFDGEVDATEAKKAIEELDADLPGTFTWNAGETAVTYTNTNGSATWTLATGVIE
jgi:prepilin-type N-terminal cleavage/methylation domain-containing protein